ncbi:MAG: CidA/LrgA family protein [Clostridiales bacterium]|nr:CidA/LrgA family protein [Clostridiales bacterium]
MKYLLQFCRILLISFASEILHEILPLPIPASIYGIIVLFGLLESGLLPLEKVRETGRFLIEIMPVMFIPAAIGIVETFDLIAPSLLNYVITVVVSTVLVMGVSGAVTQLVIRSRAKGGKTHE